MTIEYDQSIVKNVKDGGGKTVSTTLEPGETLISGATYEQELERLGKAPESSPFAQGSMIEDNQNADPAWALTLDETLTHTKRDRDEAQQPAAVADPKLDTVATLNEDQSATKIVKDGNDPEKDVVYVDPPRESDSKQEWFDYATEHKGLDKDYEDVTKNEIIAFVRDVDSKKD